MVLSKRDLLLHSSTCKIFLMSSLIFNSLHLFNSFDILPILCRFFFVDFLLILAISFDIFQSVVKSDLKGEIKKLMRSKVHHMVNSFIIFSHADFSAFKISRKWE